VFVTQLEAIPMGVQLVVRMTEADRQRLENGGTFSAGDRLAVQVKTFLEANELPYSEQFVSVACFPAGVEPEGLYRAYGPVGAVLKIDRVINRICLIGAEDIQNLASWGYRDRRKRDRGRRYLEQLCALLGPPTVRLPRLIEFVRKWFPKTMKYVEARVKGAITRDDIEGFIE
jgi:hypothetical protein